MDNPSPDRRTLHFRGYLGIHIEKDPKDGKGELFRQRGTLCLGVCSIPFVLERVVAGRPEKLYTNGKDILVTVSRLMPVKDERPEHSTFTFCTNAFQFQGSIPDTHLKEFFGEFGWAMVKGQCVQP